MRYRQPPSHAIPATSMPCDTDNLRAVPWRQSPSRAMATAYTPCHCDSLHAMEPTSKPCDGNSLMPCHGDSLYAMPWQQHKPCHGDNLRAMRYQQPHSHGNSLLLLNIIDYPTSHADILHATPTSYKTCRHPTRHADIL
jgi:hypothetical protein